jgi:cyclopropane fatty-acyl-phospholipid synthase-like methyltransferase
MPADDTLCGWGDEAKVDYFFANADVIVPRRAEQINLLADLLPQAPEAPLSVLDLGAGFGAVSEQILNRYLRATVTCVDGSAVMVARATERLLKYGERVRILRADLADAAWKAVVKGTVFEVVVSAIAIHHLTHERKRELDREVFQLLVPGGIFLNNDIVATPAALKTRFEDLNIAAIQDQERARRGSARTKEQIRAEMQEQLRLAGGRHQSHIASLGDQLGWLREAGFKSIDCYWRYLDLAIFGGVKEEGAGG